MSSILIDAGLLELTFRSQSVPMPDSNRIPVRIVAWIPIQKKNVTFVSQSALVLLHLLQLAADDPPLSIGLQNEVDGRFVTAPPRSDRFH